MNPLLENLQDYPFERLKRLLEGVVPNGHAPLIKLSIGEPQHPTPAVITEALTQSLKALSQYPTTLGLLSLRQACANWVERRYRITLDPETQILPVLGSREALFSIAQALLDPLDTDTLVLMPNPFYQIYEGACYLAGASPFYIANDPQQSFAPNWSALTEKEWRRVQMVYVCSPHNPTGYVMKLDEWKWLLEQSDRYGFTIVSDECYSEIYTHTPPLGALEACVQLGRNDFKRVVALTSLSKRSNAPGLRSGFASGDAKILASFLQYRTYHGSAMSLPIQQASIAAWNDEAHVISNRQLYQEKFKAVLPLLQSCLQVQAPQAGFYLWARIPDSFEENDEAFAQQLYQQYNVLVLPGCYLGRKHQNKYPGKGYVRMALVAPIEECIEAAKRIVQFCS